MKRHDALEPFSRDHYAGLVVARHLMLDQNEASLRACVEYWNREMQDHFQEEERLLAPLATPEMAQRMKQEHNVIREKILAAQTHHPDSDELREMGQTIHDHIRWEERELFPLLEKTELGRIALESHAMEERRHVHSPGRAIQVKRREARQRIS